MAQECQFIFKRDEFGREIAIPKEGSAARRGMLWKRRMEYFGHTEPLWNIEKLDAFQKKVLGKLSNGECDAILFGRAGSGKTTVALLALRKLFMDGNTAMVSRFSQFKRKMEPRYCEAYRISPDDVLEEHCIPGYLLLDDLGYGGTMVNPSDHEQRIFFDLVNARQGSGKKTWIISNANRERLYAMYGDAAVSRLETTGKSVVGDFTKRKNYRFE